MGYEEPETILRLEFEDPKYDGLVVRMRAVPSGQFFRLLDLAESLSESDRPDTSNLPRDFRELLNAFSDNLVSWNLTKNGEPREPTLEVIEQLDLMFVMDLTLAWLGGFQAVPGPLGERSSYGETSPTPPLPMDVL